MAISINWGTKVISVPQSYLTFISGVLYELNVNTFRLDLKDLEDSADGMAFPATHNHNTAVVLSGVTYARTVEVFNGYTVQFEDGQYVVRCVGANHNLADVKVANQVSLIIGNSAGLIETGTSGLTATESAQLALIETVDTKVDTVDGKVVNLDGDVAAVAGQVTTVDTVVDGIATAVATVDGKVVNLDGDVAAVAGQVTNLDADVAAVAGQVTTVDTVVDGIATAVATVDGKVVNLDGDVAAVAGQVTTLDGKVVNLDGDVAAVAGQVTTVDTVVDGIATAVATVDGKVVNLDGDVAAVAGQITTVDGKLPAALVGGKMNSALDATERDAAAAALLDLAHGIETNQTLRKAMRYLLAVLVGKSSGAGADAPVFRDINDMKNRVSGTLDADGNRTSVTVDGA